MKGKLYRRLTLPLVPAGDGQQQVGRQREARRRRGRRGAHAAAVEGAVGVVGDGGLHAVLLLQQHGRAAPLLRARAQAPEQALAETVLLCTLTFIYSLY